MLNMDFNPLNKNGTFFLIFLCQLEIENRNPYNSEEIKSWIVKVRSLTGIETVLIKRQWENRVIACGRSLADQTRAFPLNR